MKSLTEEIEKSNIILTNWHTKMKTVKEDTQTYKQSLAVVEPETLVSIPDEIVLGICIRVIHESFQYHTVVFENIGESAVRKAGWKTQDSQGPSGLDATIETIFHLL